MRGKKFISRLLVFGMVIALFIDRNLIAVLADSISVPDGRYLVSNTEQAIAPGIIENEIITNSSSGDDQTIDYTCSIDLSGTSTTKIISGYTNYNASTWSMDTVSNQAKSAEKSTGYNVVAAINADFYNMSTGEPIGALVMEGKIYHNANGRPYFAILKDGTPVIRYGNVSLEDVESAVGGDTIIVENGNIANLTDNSTYQNIKYSRCAIGIKEDGTVVTFTTHGMNAPISCGNTYKEIADTMIKLGCVTVLNLDGGGSSTYCSQYEGSDELLCRNNPSDGNERKVSSSILIVSTAKASGEFDHASVSPNNLVYTPKSSVEFKATGVDSAGGSAQLPSDLSWQLDDNSKEYGEINDKGVFTSNGKTGEVKVNVISNGKVVGSTSITIAQPDSISFTNEEISLGFDKSSDLGLTVKYKGRDVIYKDGDFKWTMDDENMGSFNGNTFISSSSATVNGYITAESTYDNNVSGKIYAIIGRLPSVMLDFEDKVNSETGEIIKAQDYFTITRDKTDTKSLLLLANYNRGGKESAELVNLDSGEPVRFGNNSLKLNYDFSGDITGTEGACIGYTEATKPVEGNPTGIGMWVYAPEGTPNLWLRIYLKDGNGNLVPLNFTEEAKISEGKMNGIDWTGWKYVEASLEGRKGPFTLVQGQTIRLMYVPGTQQGFYTKGTTKEDGSYEMVEVPKAQRKGAIYIDNLQFVYGANNDDIDNPSVDSITANDIEIKDGMIIDTNTINFKSLFSDTENKNTSGIDYDTVRIYIDGVNMSEGKNCVLVPGDNAINLYDTKLSNGPHIVKVLVRDKFGNETTRTRYFTVKGETEYTNIKLSPITEGNPVLNKIFELGLATDNIEDIKSIDTEIKINDDFKDYEVKFNEDFEGTATYDSKTSTIKLNATRKEGQSLIDSLFLDRGEANIATISFKVPKELKKGSKFTYCAQKGQVNYNSEKEDGFTGTFATLQESLDVVAPLVIKADSMIVGSSGKIYVDDLDNKPVADSSIYKSDGTLLGKTNEEGYLETDELCKEASKYTIYAVKGEDISYSINVQSSNSAGNEDGLPEYVISNATSSSTNSKNITWMSNPQKSDNKAIIQVAKKSDYDANGESSFKNYEGTSKLQSFLGSSDASKNYSVRVNKVLANNLISNTEYVYRVGDGKAWSDIKEFKTVRAGKNTNFFVIGDTQIANKDKVDEISNQLSKGNYSFGIQTGDSIDDASVYSHWVDVLQLFGNSYLSGVDMVHVLGNHEYMGDSDGDAAQNIYNIPNSRRYSVEYGNVYVATISYTTSKSQLKEDLEWLVQDAKNSKAKWKVITMHQPAYYTNPSGSNEMINELVPGAAEEAGIDFVFSGHDHSYARTEPIKNGEVDKDNGTVYYICGSTGEKSYGVVNNEDFHFANGPSTDFDSIYLTVSTTDKEFKVETHESDGSVIDTYTKTDTTSECSKNGHKYVYDNGYLTCSECGHDREPGDYTGFATDKSTGKAMYFINGQKKIGWFTYGTKDIYYFDKNGLAEVLTVIEDIPTTCTEQGYKIVMNSLGVKKTVKYDIALGHKYEKVIDENGNSKYVCSVCGHEVEDISTYKISMATRSLYSGVVRQPPVSIEGLKRGVDYTVTYYNNVDVGIATAKIKGIGNYEGTVVKTFVIYRNIKSMNIDLDYSTCSFDGKEKRPEVSIEGLTEGVDYSVAYSNNINVGTGEVIIRGLGTFYTGTVTKIFTINKGDISKLEANLSYTTCYYDGNEKRPEAKIDGLKEGTDFEVTYANNVEVGEGKIIITAIGNYTGEIIKTFTISDEISEDRIDISTYDITISNTTCDYTGSEIKPTLTIEGLKEGTDYTVTYSNNINPGEGKITIVGVGKYKGTVTKIFTIKDNRVDISTYDINLSYGSIAYSGSAKKPIVTIDGLTKGIDFEVTYSNNINPGEAKVTIEGIGEYTGKVTKAFIIYRNISKLVIDLGYTSCTYDGEEKKPKVMIEGLTEGIDYSVIYLDNVNVGTGKAIIKGINNCYIGTVTKTFTINKGDISNVEANLSYITCDYDGSEKRPGVKIEGLKEGTDFEVTYSNNVEVGEGKVIIKGIGNYIGEIIKTFTISDEINEDRIDISTYDIEISNTNYDYTGSEIKPTVTINGLKEGTDFEVSYSNNIEVGEGTITIVGLGNYKGTVTKTFTIKDNRVDISTYDINLSYGSIAYSGSAKKPTVTIDGLTKGIDFEVTYSNNINPGEAKVTIEGIGKYKGKVIKIFIIYRNISNLAIDLSYTSCTYDGEEKKPEVTIKGLTKGLDYSVSYSNNINVGTGKVIVKGINNYYIGTVTKTFTISEKNISNLQADLSYIPNSEDESDLMVKDLSENKDYVVTYSDNKKESKQIITIKGIGNYTGKKVLEMPIDIKRIIEKDGFRYNIDKDENAILVLYTGNETEVNIPTKINNYKVEKIKSSTFSKNRDLKKVIIPNSVNDIEDLVFKNCKEIIICGSLESYANKYADENDIVFKSK